MLVGFLMVPAGGNPTSPQQQSAGPIAFSARLSGKAKEHVSTGVPTLIEYNKTLSNVGGGWDGDDTFKVPEDGFYFFSIEFVRDAYSNGGTADDVYVYLQTKESGGSPLLRANGWAGEGSGNRATGAVSTVLKLTKDTLVRTKAGSDGNVTRYIPDVYFSGFLVK